MHNSVKIQNAIAAELKNSGIFVEWDDDTEKHVERDFLGDKSYYCVVSTEEEFENAHQSGSIVDYWVKMLMESQRGHDEELHWGSF